jgi:hypothetical protein
MTGDHIGLFLLSFGPINLHTCISPKLVELVSVIMFIFIYLPLSDIEGYFGGQNLQKKMVANNLLQ